MTNFKFPKGIWKSTKSSRHDKTDVDEIFYYFFQSIRVWVCDVTTFSLNSGSLENISHCSAGSGMSPPAYSSDSDQTKPECCGECAGAGGGAASAQYGSVLLDIVSGTAHWSPEAPRRAITPDRGNIGAVFRGHARHCKLLLNVLLILSLFRTFLVSNLYL